MKKSALIRVVIYEESAPIRVWSSEKSALIRVPLNLEKSV
jgi:hypothetical protein